jgi:hypothetical protein
MPIHPTVAKQGIAYLSEHMGFDFTVAEFTAICKGAKITRYMNRCGEFATGERETFCDAMAKRFTGFDHWPYNGEGFDNTEEFIAQLRAGYAAFKAGKPNPHDPRMTGKILVHRGLLVRVLAVMGEAESFVADSLGAGEAVDATFVELKKLAGELAATLNA